MKRVSVGVLGATGIVGQKYIELLCNHPWFEVTYLSASERSAGRSFEEAIERRSHLSSSLPKSIRELPVHTTEDITACRNTCELVFSALSGEKTYTYEEDYAAAGLAVVSNTSAHRHDPDVPLLIPEINSHHLEKLITIQRRLRGWDRGSLIVKPNCSIQSYMLPLYPLHQQYRLKSVVVTMLQAVSGAGYPGVPSLDMIDNLVPFIPGEEEKSEREPKKILGALSEQGIVPEDRVEFSAHCIRVPVVDGHTACVSVAFESTPSPDEVLALWKNFRGAPQELKLPSAPSQPIVYLPENNRPQPRKDRMSQGGMAATVGRLRPCPVADLRFVALTHNTIRGAAGGGVLNAELLVAQGLVGR